ncbi:MAG: phage terminase small subunit P27 family [Planctomycetota bacterium]
MRGRKPKPTAIKELTGNPGKRALNKSEPKPAAKLPACPKHLGDEARKEWRRVTKQLADLNLLTDLDRAVLAAYCQAWGRWVEAETELRKHGPVVKSPSGYPIQNPYLSIANKAMEQMRKLLPELGLSPSSRSRIQTPTDAEADDGFDL